MDLPIRFCITPSGARIAYATIGEGPPLVWCPKWISHLERLWAHSAFRTFMRTLARRHTIILYDRYGCGLSDRDRTDFSEAADAAVLEAFRGRLPPTRPAAANRHHVKSCPSRNQSQRKEQAQW